ncbi:hypothetical protein BSL78_22856 [Apostichopus japonicus]|uniref:Uncharacterized protein n=1 Tax=Stichopus japonicus TaxID=307972 RepID=A0A2G8JWY7_STIJA|nr:hypothetical protein BSL78_22856 [Apostichopus japonicus]
MASSKDGKVPGLESATAGDVIDAPVRVFLWMVPRTCSTVITKCMSFVDDCVVWMEPYCMCHLNETEFNPEFKKDDPDMMKYNERRATLMQSGEIQQLLAQIQQKAALLPNLNDQTNFTHSWVQEQLSQDEPSKKVIFVKDETFAIVSREEFLPKVPFRHTFLIRHPREVFVSFRKMVAETGNFGLIKEEDCDPVRDGPTLPAKEFYKTQLDMLNYVTKNIEPNPIVIDAHDFLSNPKAMLSKYFEMLEIPFKDSFLSWEGDMSHVETKFRGSPMGVVAVAEKDTLKKAFTSTSFKPPKYPRGVVADDVKFTPELEKLIEDAMPYYEEMFSKRLVLED